VWFNSRAPLRKHTRFSFAKNKGGMVSQDKSHPLARDTGVLSSAPPT